ncbi:pyridoxamine 5'-phosphate oxidase [Streptococcus sanguinis SK150]|uniref:Pyridoxamine 5'-phosphate oxidase n=1 Tax=Streptococcus sanguinis SK150 TaxID=888811 RepID=F0ILG4_STRSA|nr:pyridoxamine 5'-phosphate oxidase [Streptococcus sanguinis SK150]
MSKMKKAIRPKILKKRMPKAARSFFVLLISFPHFWIALYYHIKIFNV